MASRLIGDKPTKECDLYWTGSSLIALQAFGSFRGLWLQHILFCNSVWRLQCAGEVRLLHWRKVWRGRGAPARAEKLKRCISLIFELCISLILNHIILWCKVWRGRGRRQLEQQKWIGVFLWFYDMYFSHSVNCFFFFCGSCISLILNHIILW